MKALRLEMVLRMNNRYRSKPQPFVGFGGQNRGIELMLAWGVSRSRQHYLSPKRSCRPFNLLADGETET